MSDIKFPKSYPEGAGDDTICRVEEEGELYILHLIKADNRFNPTSMPQIQKALEDIQAHYWHERDTEEKPRALVTTGQKHIFSNGLNLEAIADVGLEPFFDMYHKLMATMLKFPIPTVAAINGHAFAGGMIFSMSHDFRVMRSDRGYLCMNEIDMPGPLSPGMSSVLQCKIPKFSTFRKVLMLGHRFSAQEALDNDLVDAIVTEKEVLQKAKEIAKSVAPKMIIGGSVYTMIRQEIVADTIRKLESGGLGFIAKF